MISLFRLVYLRIFTYIIIYICIYLFIFLASDEIDEIEDQLVTTTKSKKVITGSGSSMKRTTDVNQKTMSKQIISTKSSNPIQNESVLKSLVNSQDGIIVVFYLVHFQK
jgi:hypothetical protein